MVNGSWAIALGMMLLLEGIIPFLFPKQWRAAFSRIMNLSDGQIRFVGLLILACGGILLGLLRLYS